MQNLAQDREDLARLTDLGGQNAPATDVDDPLDLWRDLGGSD